MGVRLSKLTGGAAITMAEFFRVEKKRKKENNRCAFALHSLRDTLLEEIKLHTGCLKNTKLNDIQRRTGGSQHPSHGAC
jgi:hypothetical protein